MEKKRVKYFLCVEFLKHCRFSIHKFKKGNLFWGLKNKMKA